MGLKLKAMFALVCLFALRANAGIWGDYIIGGSACNSGNVSVIDNGDSIAVLFDSFGINMPQNTTGDGLNTRKTCNFRVSLTPPKGFYLAGFRQVYSGGIIKSLRTSAQLNVRYNIGSVVGQPLPITWTEAQRIQPSDANSMFSKTYYNNLLVASCGGKTVYGLNMTFSAARRTANDFLIAGLDSVDADFEQKVILIPEWRLCN